MGQAWRDGAHQARLALALAMIDVRPVALTDAEDAGALLASAGSADVVDALVALLALPGDQLLTSDPGDLGRLIDARQVEVRIVVV